MIAGERLPPFCGNFRCSAASKQQNICKGGTTHEAETTHLPAAGSTAARGLRQSRRSDGGNGGNEADRCRAGPGRSDGCCRIVGKAGAGRGSDRAGSDRRCGWGEFCTRSAARRSKAGCHDDPLTVFRPAGPRHGRKRCRRPNAGGDGIRAWRKAGGSECLACFLPRGGGRRGRLGELTLDQRKSAASSGISKGR